MKALKVVTSHAERWSIIVTGITPTLMFPIEVDKTHEPSSITPSNWPFNLQTARALVQEVFLSYLLKCLCKSF